VFEWQRDMLEYLERRDVMRYMEKKEMIEYLESKPTNEQKVKTLSGVNIEEELLKTQQDS